ncbi:hypothetical protein [Leuconostoc gelidum]|uniref:hypothetical protein n=3 Tax=Leuconostoc gelidum TaxID=1244 RepID=UPI002180B3A8|nr:hypothetical protein [Leuconostoc gelidum]
MSSLMLLGLLGGAMILQNITFNAQLKSRSQMIILTKLDQIQLQASLAYHKSNRQKHNFGNVKTTVVKDNIVIELGHETYTRKLLV